jgi:uncharacterized membrane protein YhiD involved in acid resistance
VAAIGTASGAGLYLVAGVGTVLILVVLFILDRVEEFARRRIGLPPEGDERPPGEPQDGRSENLL